MSDLDQLVKYYIPFDRVPFQLKIWLVTFKTGVSLIKLLQM